MSYEEEFFTYYLMTATQLITGTGAIIISPTRELSLQIYGVLRDLMENAGHIQTHGLVMGGEPFPCIQLFPKITIHQLIYTSMVWTAFSKNDLLLSRRE